MHRLLPWLLLALTATTPAAAADQPGGVETGADAVSAAQRLEEQPLGRAAKRLRLALKEWLFGTPEVTVPYCRVLISPLILDFRYGDLLADQVLFSSAALMIDHPELASGDRAIYVAGISGALEAYRSIVRQKPKLRDSRLDGLLRLYDEGRLERFVEDGMVSCSSRDTDT